MSPEKLYEVARRKMVLVRTHLDDLSVYEVKVGVAMVLPPSVCSWARWVGAVLETLERRPS